MSRLVIKCFILLIYFVQIKCDVFYDRPKIKASNGDLILKPAFGKSIYLSPNGPKSTIYIGEINALKVDSTNKNGQLQSLTNTGSIDNGQDTITQRIIRLENENALLNRYLNSNMSQLMSEINDLNMKVLTLRAQSRQRSRDACRSQPCMHGSTCLNLRNGYYCLCPSNWEGKDCDVDVNECRNFAGTDLGCQNGAICMNRPGSYECLCKSGWFGVHCTRKAKDCSGGDFEMCGHGTCIQTSSGDGVKCICHQGWTNNGTSFECLTDVNECEENQTPRCSVNPRVECINLPGSFRCGRCPSGYEGDGFSCSDINECVTISNGGCSPLVMCHNTIGSRICGVCPLGYQGDGVTCTWKGSCTTNNGGCHPSAHCISATAVGGPGIQCICPNGMEGDGVGLQGCYVASTFNFTHRCGGNPCGIHGQCHALRNGYTCVCFKGFSGTHCDIPKNLCADNPCLNGGVCRVDDTLLVGYTCECTAQYTGALCQIRAKACGGVLDNEEGSIMYPMSNTTYSHRSRCAWVIHTVPNKVINVTFSKFDLERHPECSFDFLQIHDGRSSASQLIGRFCGNNFPNGGNIVSSHNNLYFWFQSDSSVAKNGFALHWTSVQPVCGGKINATTHGHISSPGSPGSYPPNRDCYWHLSTSYGKRIQLHFFELDLETHVNCSFDYLVIYDGEHTTDPLLSKYCNSTQPAPVQSAGSDILIHFHSDAYGAGKGFQITYAPTEGIPGCGGYFTGDKGEISSPSFNGMYMKSLLCEYKIKTGEGTKIQIEFKSFKLENSLRCSLDYLKIYDGPTSDAGLVGKFCGTTFPKTYTSSTNNLFLKFKTDQSVSFEGFVISYKALCHTEIFGDSGEVKSPGYPYLYPEDKVCEYVISTTPGKVIQLTFQELDIENIADACPYDYVEVRDGPDVNSTLFGKYCGGTERIPPTLISSHNFIYMKFYSDLSMTGSGFYANFTTKAVECGGIYRATTGLINHPSDSSATYQNSQSCSWILIAPEGFHIILSWNRFNLERTPDCDGDYVSLVEIEEDNNNNILDKFCGTNTPPALTTSTNRLMIQFESDSSYTASGFSVSYTFLDDKTHCGGTYRRTHGFIYSPGWPKPYEPNQDCKWIIVVPFGQQIKLNISQFDLEQPIRDKCNLGDYLEIRNGASENSPLIGQICGTFQSRRVISTANVLYLHFHSDFYLTGKGFQIEWDGTITGCGGTLTTSTGSIASPNYPNNYNENAECFYRIITNSGSRIRISFTELELEQTHKCKDDYIEIFNGRDSSAATLGKYCSMSPLLNNVETSSNHAFIKFRSDYYISAKGFYLNYNSICDNDLTGRYGVIESPDYPNRYPQHLNCLWNITVPKGNRINITFTHFSIFMSFRYNHNRFRRVRNRGCEQDYLQTKDGADNTFTSKLCGYAMPAPFTTKSNSLLIKFVTGYISNTGFRLEWVIHGCGGHIQKEYGILNLDKSSTSSNVLECEWLIEVALGKSVAISFTEVYLSETVNCTLDAIEIYNGPDSTYPLLSKICNRQRASVTAHGNYMLVKLVKQSSLKEVYFKSIFHSQRSVCGGIVQSKSGLIYSKNYPKNYDDNLDCMWTIEVPSNHRIQLNFIDLDLYSISPYDDDETKCADHIEVYDNISLNYTHKICSNFNKSQIITKSSSVHIRFVTDSYGNAKGFKANFTAICGATITALHEEIITSDLNNPTNSCTWTIVTPNLDQKISLTITYMSLPKSNDGVSNRTCSLSYLHIYDGDDNKAPLIGEYCGRKVPSMIVSQGSAITIELGTNREKIVGRFTAHYSPWNNTCGGSLFSEEGFIASPNYPRPYYGGDDCEWILVTSPGNRVYITFEELNLELSDRCNEDYLEIRENSGGGKLLGLYCGTDIPTNITTSTKLYIKFHSNKKNNGEGFLIHYGFLHGNEIIGENGVVSSPLYPNLYHGPGEYYWRIIASGTQAITLTVDHLEIQSYGSVCYNKLSIYDGYDETASILDELCGILNSGSKTVQTSSSAVYLSLTMDESNTGSLFRIVWTTDRALTDPENTEKINCGFNNTELITSGRSKIFQSPNYPQDYGNELNCQWIFKTVMGNHLKLHFNHFEIEESGDCHTDSLSLYSSDILGRWASIKENICVMETPTDFTNISNYLMVRFQTDMSVTKKGFYAKVSSLCGGLVTNLSGTIEPLWLNFQNDMVRSDKVRCDWTIKVRPGRLIKLQFEHFNITNVNNKCLTSVILHNGDSVNAPLLANGKYCGDPHENKSNIITSSNALFISYIAGEANHLRLFVFQNFRIRFEEKSVECGFRATLDIDHPWEKINSPHYPSIPEPYSECFWIITGPPGEILRLDFLDRFDLDDVDDCTTEAVEIRDGSSEFAPLLKRCCSDKPGTIKSKSNVMFIKYFTQLAEPRNGFKANISIDVCGGTYASNSGEILSPGYPHMTTLPYDVVCEWTIRGSPRTSLLLKSQDIDLPDSEEPCGTYISVQELLPANNTIVILKKICNDDVLTENSLIETSTNEVIIMLHIGKPSEWTKLSEYRGFKFSFNSSRPLCGGLITTSEGYLTTPGYPLSSTLRYCQWLIKVPNKDRRVRLEILDADMTKHKIGIYNDLSFQSLIKRIPDDDGNISNLVFDSTGNKIAIYLWLNPLITRHRFKAKFSSDEPVLCGGSLHGVSGTLESPELQRSYTCEWHYNNIEYSKMRDTFEYNTILITVHMNSSVSRTRCRYLDPKLKIMSLVSNKIALFTRNVCGNTDVFYRIPSSVIDLRATKLAINSLYFRLEWKSQPCGGILHAAENPTNVLMSLPNSYNDTLDCAWIVLIPGNRRAKIKMEGSFVLDCDDEFIQISQGLAINSPLIGEFCKSKAPDAPLLTNFKFLYIQYHSKFKNKTHLKLYVSVITDECGEYLLNYETTFKSPNFPKNYYPNLECTWEIKADLGNRISLSFVERFVIEDRVNCTKDVVIVYDWKPKEYTEMARLCGRNLPHSYNSTFNRMKVVLRTDADTNLDGFKAHWSPICGGILVASEKEQFLYSPQFPNEYPPLLSCFYEISAPDKKVFIEFLEFDLEGTYPECKYDNLTIYTEGYNYNNEMFCGNKMPSPLSAEKISLDFKTDNFKQGKGFKLSYKIYSCGGHVNKTTTITSNVFEYYHENMNCTWIIAAPSNKTVVIKFLYIDIEGNSDCDTDYVSVFEGQIIDSNRRLALLCGNINSTTVIRSSGNAMILQFVTDLSVQYKGFKAIVLFSYSTSAGCGDAIEMKAGSSQILKSPLMNDNVVYENYLDCLWTVIAPVDTQIKIEFTSFHVAPCQNVNQTALGYNKCDCDFAEIMDGLNPDSLVIGKYCGHTKPSQLVSSGNRMSVRLMTDGEIVSSGFIATLSTQQSICGQTQYIVSNQTLHLKSPGYDAGAVPRGINCMYNIINSINTYTEIHFIIALDLQEPTVENDGSSICSKDKLVISSIPTNTNMTVGKNFVLHSTNSDFFSTSSFYDQTFPKQLELCGHKDIVDLYIYGSVYVNLITSAESDEHKGFKMEISQPGSCSRNYSEPYGRIYILEAYKHEIQDCYRLISAPENHTIAIYFMELRSNFWYENSYLDILDGNSINSAKIIRIQTGQSSSNNPVFSTGRYLLLHDHYSHESGQTYSTINYDLNYITTNKGQGCGGKIVNEIGRVTSPFYPSNYRKKSTCEWELETPSNTRLLLRFSTFDMNMYCNQNYLQVVDRTGAVQATYCSETPADFTSSDNYVKLVYVTTMNNGGTGWVADFVGVKK